ncbi:MAG TPA: biotin/lipoyl-binding protein [Bacteroidales bacterium]|nr:biotin/lipoyl-binding protein [Bacteroidales bacterium]
MKKFKFTIEGSSFEVSIHEVNKNIVEIEVNGTPFTVEIEKSETSTISGIKTVSSIATPPLPITIPTAIKSPLPGVIKKILVTKGQKVKRGDILLIMESMKMENNITAEKDGVVKALHINVDQTVMQGDILIDFEGSVEVVKQSSKTNASASNTNGKHLVTSPLPGVILKTLVSVGQKVKRGDTLLIMESMKMENNILADKDGVVKSITVEIGQSVMQGDTLFELNQ